MGLEKGNGSFPAYLNCPKLDFEQAMLESSFTSGTLTGFKLAQHLDTECHEENSQVTFLHTA
jgi:hypothetical protein